MSCCNVPRTTDEIPQTRQKVFVFLFNITQSISMIHHPQINNAQNQFHIFNTTLSKTHSVAYSAVVSPANMKTTLNIPQAPLQLSVFTRIK